MRDVVDLPPSASSPGCQDSEDGSDGSARIQRAADEAGLHTSAGEPKGSLLVVSHPAVLSVNQELYGELSRRGWELTLVVPSRWRHPYSAADLHPRALAGLESSLRPTRVALPGRPQRYFHLTRPRSLLARTRPDVAFIEAEPYSLVSGQWALALARLSVPFGVQCYENIDRALPLPARWLRAWVLHRAAFIAARSESAARLARSWGARGEIGLAPPAVPGWAGVGEIREPSEVRPFTVGYAGRLIESKGLTDLLEAVRGLQAPVELVLAGDGDLKGALAGQPVPGSKVRILEGVTHDQMPSVYAQLDVLVLPSHTTATWTEQFGRVIVEALWCGVPVIGSDSGEIPWVIGLTEGGLVFPEGDRAALTERLQRLRSSPELGRSLAAAGRSAVERLFSVPAATDSLERLLVAAMRSRH
jgi:glycosyltransferase involved in cell wall biosynthesis